MRRFKFSVLYEVFLVDLRWRIDLPGSRVIVVVAVVKALDSAVVPPLLPGNPQKSLLWRGVVAVLSVLAVLDHRNTILCGLVSPLVRPKCFPIVPLLPPLLPPVQSPLSVMLPTLPV